MTDAVDDPVEALFLQVVELPPSERAAFLDSACRGDAALRIEVESLLAYDKHGATCEILPHIALAPEHSPVANGAGPRGQQPELPERIGRYRILRPLGEGGMGVVYEAEQANPRRLVALKVIRPGIVSPEQIERFDREAQILGRLHHLGIAEIYDAGLSEDGRPYFAMEFIRGTRLDEYARSRLTDWRERLSLLARVCDAVQHAHDSGIIHRDLKPSNILVDDAGQPKVLDFGVARAQSADWYTAGAHTHTGQLIGTPQYMSPEQIAEDPRAVDGRTDVYALGLMLFELLSDKRPYQVENLPLPEVVRVIREHEPARLGTLNTTLRGDAETIVAKAIEKDKTRRYASAGELAADIRRLLNDEPILARPASAAYRMQKFVQRYKTLVVAACAVIATLVLGLAATVWMYLDAQREADKATKARDFLASILRISQTDDRGGGVPARQTLADAQRRIPLEFADQPELRAELLRVTDDVQLGMARKAPRAMILDAQGDIDLQTAGGQKKDALPHALVYMDDRLTLSAGAQAQLVFLSDLHKERLRPGRQATVDLTGCHPSDAVLERDNSILMTFARLPKGRFLAHHDYVTKKLNVWTQIEEDFEISAHEVTQAQWQAVMGANPSSFSRRGKNQQDVLDLSDEELKLLPVESVSWHEVQEFLRKLNERELGRGFSYRLPMVAEWEYACRAAATTRNGCSYSFYFAEPTNDLSSELANFNGNRPFGNAPDGKFLRRPARVGSYPANKLGLCDMHGNVWEWCDVDETGKAGQPARGGGWFDAGETCQASTISRGKPTYRHHDLGFRLVRVPVQ